MYKTLICSIRNRSHYRNSEREGIRKNDFKLNVYTRKAMVYISVDFGYMLNVGVICVYCKRFLALLCLATFVLLNATLILCAISCVFFISILFFIASFQYDILYIHLDPLARVCLYIYIQSAKYV